MKNFIVLSTVLLLCAASSLAAEIVGTSTDLVVIHGKSIENKALSFNDQVVMIQGDVVSLTKGIDLKQASQMASVDDGFSAVIAKGVDVLDTNCADGIYILTAEEGNFIPRPDRTESYKIPKVVAFTCVNK